MKHLARLLLAACGLAFFNHHAVAADAAADYPAKPIRLVVDFPAGGTIDSLARVVGQQLGELWGQTVVVENHPGAGGNIGAQLVYGSDGDGYTLLATPPGPLSINEYLYKSLAFAPSRFAAIGMLGSSPNAVTANAALPVNSVQDLIAYAKAHPGALSYGSQGNGSTSHLTGQLFATLSNTDLVHVPYKGEGPAMTDMMAGRIQLFFGNISAVLKLLDTGKVKILAVAGNKRTSLAPDVPSTEEAGFHGFSSSAWFALMAPPGTPAAIGQKLNAALVTILNKDEVKKKFLALGVEATPTSPAETDASIQEERARWKRVIADGGARID